MTKQHSPAPHPMSCDPASDLCRRARRAVVEGGFEIDFSEAELAEVSALQQAATAPAQAAITDLRMLPWSSIDNGDSRDLDQIEVAERLENDIIRVRIGIADVDSRVARVGAIDAHAAQNATTVYTGVAVFPMLPLALSTDLTSLAPAADRAAVVVQLDIAADGSVTAGTLYRALVRNHAQLAYESVGAWLAGAAPLPAAAGQVAGLAEQLKLQDEAAQRLLAARRRAGSLDFETVEARAVVQGGRVVDLAVTHKDRARRLIENFMVAANGAVADYLADAGRLGLGRIVRRPARWPRIVAIAAALGEELPQEPDARRLSAFLERRKAADPLHYSDLSLSIVKLLGPGEYEVMRPGAPSAGHFGLAVSRYAHSTAPNRRYADLISQRLVKAALAGATAPYNDEALARLAAHCTEREGAAQKVERTMRKVAAALLFGHRIGQSFDAVVTGSSQKGTWVRTLHPPVEGRLMADRHHGARVDAADVGDRVRVKLLHTDSDRGWIDFGLEE